MKLKNRQLSFYYKNTIIRFQFESDMFCSIVLIYFALFLIVKKL